jgi:hypothetical protein
VRARKLAEALATDEAAVDELVKIVREFLRAITSRDERLRAFHLFGRAFGRALDEAGGENLVLDVSVPFLRGLLSRWAGEP